MRARAQKHSPLKYNFKPTDHPYFFMFHPFKNDYPILYRLIAQ